MSTTKITNRNIAIVCGTIVLAGTTIVRAQFSSQGRAVDPGVRGGMEGAGGAVAGLTPYQLAYFDAGKEEFEEAEELDEGLGPTMNLDSCVGCHSQPSTGGTSPAINPQFAFATAEGAWNIIPSFIRQRGPVREARFVRGPNGEPDGGVHALFTIAGRQGAHGCGLAQPDFAAALAANNVVFRIPTPTFGLGLVEQIPDQAIRANQSANASEKNSLGIRGRTNVVLSGNTISGLANTNGNDGTIARFGWKAQNKSLLLFAGEAYNVEMGISNEIFMTERDESRGCQFAKTPNDVSNLDATVPAEVLSDTVRFALFMRFLAPPVPSTTSPGGTLSIRAGRQVFESVGCAHCHTPTMYTGNSTVDALSHQSVNLYSDLLVHDMGAGLADGVSQGMANGREFRTAPLWGLGQRIFFLHDGRANDLIAAIQAHAENTWSTNASEAFGVIQRFNNLTEKQKQDLLNFLRSL